MKKILLAFGALSLLFLAACDEEDLDQTINEVEQDEIVNDSEEAVEGTDNDLVEKDTNVEEDNNSDAAVSNENNEQPADNDSQTVQDIGENIIWAQMDEDYSYLKSIVAEGVTVNEDNNTIEFNTDEATHTFEFLTGVEEDDLEFRFVDGEDTDQAIAGFAAIDYENEYSYVVEMIFNNVNGDWKLTSMDINK